MKKLIIVILMLFVLVGCSKRDLAYDDDLFNDGLLAVSADGSSWGYINPKGEMVIDDKFDGAGAFYKGHAIVIVDQFYQVIDKNGDFVFDLGYDYLRRSPNTGLLIFEQDDLFGIMDDDENVIVEPIYKSITDYSEGYVLVVTPGFDYYYLDEQGNRMHDESFSYATLFKNGYATVRNDEGKTGLINDEFELVIDYIYDDISVVDKYGYAVTRIDNDIYEPEDNSCNLIKVDDMTLILEDYEYIKFNMVIDIRYDTPLYKAYEDDAFVLYLNDGTRFTEDEYVWVETIGDYLITFQDKNRVPTEPYEELREYAIYDEDGTLIKKASILDSKHVFQWLDGDDMGLYLMVVDGDFIDIYGQDAEYRVEADDVKGLSDDLIFATKDGLFGAFDFDGEIVIDFKYEYLFEYEDGYIEFKLDSKWGVMNSKYEVIVEPIYEYRHSNYQPRVIPQT